MSPENTYKLVGFYMEVLILGVILQYMHGFCSFKLFPIECIGLNIHIPSLQPVCIHIIMSLDFKLVMLYLKKFPLEMGSA